MVSAMASMGAELDLETVEANASAWAASDVCHRSGSAHSCDPKSAAAEFVRAPQPEFSSKNRAVALLAVWILCVLALTLLCEPG